MYVKFERWSRNDTFMVNSLDFSREQTVLQNSSGVISNNKIKTNTPESILSACKGQHPECKLFTTV